MGFFSNHEEMSKIMGELGRLNANSNNKIEEIKETKPLTINDVFSALKEKINKYNELSRNSESVEVDNSEIFKIEEEIKSLKAKIDELNSSIEGKSKIEKIKITLNVTSIESEITLKEMDLEEQKKKAKKYYEARIQSSNKDLENTKRELEEFIKDTERKLAETTKSKMKKGNLKLTILQEEGLNKLGLTIYDLSKITLTDFELYALEKLSTYSKEEVKKLKVRNDKPTKWWVGAVNVAISGEIVGATFDVELYSNRLLTIKNNKITKQKLIKGTELEEVKKYYDNIMKVELLNLENIEKEEVTITGEEKKKLEIKKEAIQNKINAVNEMVDEMIKEVIKEELKKREIVIPAFVPVTKYFNAPSEEE